MAVTNVYQYKEGCPLSPAESCPVRQQKDDKDNTNYACAYSEDVEVRYKRQRDEFEITS